jgi:hypothetical protein
LPQPDCRIARRRVQCFHFSVEGAHMSKLAEGDTVAMTGELIVRLAELEIDPAQLHSYKALLAEEIEASVKTEQGAARSEAKSAAIWSVSTRNCVRSQLLVVLIVIFLPKFVHSGQNSPTAFLPQSQ